jgi:uncharacterized protein (TIGR02466 family)
MYTSISEFIFPKQIILSINESHYKYKKQYLELCYTERQKNLNGVKISNYGGWQSGNILDNNKSNDLIDAIEDQINFCMQSQFDLQKNKKFKLDNLWINISKKNNYNYSHNHPMSYYSGVYYIQCPENCGNIVFEDSSNNVVDLLYRNQKIKEDNKMFENYYYNVKEGLMILFPSNLMHRVEPNQSDEDRISISFNLI